MRRGTSTSNFGAGGRESHDATDFYRRFSPPRVSADDTVLPPAPIAEPFIQGDARDLSAVADGSVALVVTSPPYFAGKQYEQEMEREGVPGSYLEYLDMLAQAFAECRRTLEPGGRIAVNVANLGRKPYRSLAADVIRILQDDLGFLLRGELVWQKAAGASGSCAWGSYRTRQPGAARRHRAGDRGEQGPLRPGPLHGSTESRRAAPREHYRRRGLHDPHPGHLVDPGGERPSGGSPGAVPGRAPRTAHPAVHLPQ